MSNSGIKNLENFKQKLNQISPSFCLAKWTSVTLHLESGHTHSCHHPSVHKVPLTEIEKNPAALHNTEFKISQRKLMMKGERPAECEYCWKIEDLRNDQTSDRYLKSASAWSAYEFDNVVKNAESPYFKPKYLEVSFSNNCQFKCSYCSANYSTAWEADLVKFGPYSNSIGKKTVVTIEEDKNEYINAFWKWWPEIKNNLHTFRITGGEPLLSPNTFKILENLIENPLPDLSLGINTNLGAPKILVDKFLNLIDKIQSKNCVKEVIIFTSIDAFGARAEYIRDGLRMEYFLENVHKLLAQSEKTTISIMCTFNALSITSFAELFDEVVKINKQYLNTYRRKPILIDISYLRHPEMMTVKVLPPEYKDKMKSIVEHIKANNFSVEGFPDKYYDLEEIKAQRLLEWMLVPLSTEEKAKFQGLFFRFFTEYNARRNKNFLLTFPEMKEFWSDCQKRSNEMRMREDLALFEKKINDLYGETIYAFIFSKKTIDFLFRNPYYFFSNSYHKNIMPVKNVYYRCLVSIKKSYFSFVMNIEKSYFISSMFLKKLFYVVIIIFKNIYHKKIKPIEDMLIYNPITFYTFKKPYYFSRYIYNERLKKLFKKNNTRVK